MKALIRAALDRLPGGQRLRAARAQFRADGYLAETGWAESFIRQKPVDRDGRPIPWITFGALSFLAGRVRPDMAVFEFGAGNSTLWWASRVKRVVSCEHDPEWVRSLEKQALRNVSLICRSLEDPGAYASSIAAYPGAFDLIVVDGGDRVNCLKQAPTRLKADGVILLDNSDRQEYAEGIRFVESQGYRCLDFHGPGPVNAYGWTTSLLYRQDNCLGI